jgi:hypothetical protein
MFKIVAIVTQLMLGGQTQTFEVESALPWRTEAECNKFKDSEDNYESIQDLRELLQTHYMVDVKDITTECRPQ